MHQRDRLCNWRGLVQNANTGPFAKKSSRISRQCQKSIKLRVLLSDSAGCTPMKPALGACESAP